jgi:hypothetical protein
MYLSNYVKKEIVFAVLMSQKNDNISTVISFGVRVWLNITIPLQPRKKKRIPKKD